MPFTLDDPPSRDRLNVAAECIVIELNDALHDLLSGLIAYACGGELDQDHAHEVRERVIRGVEDALRKFRSIGF
jgi:hypothetical protein